MNEHKVKIIAKSAKEFAEIETLLEKVPIAVYRQIETAEKDGLVSILKCHFKLLYETEQRFFLPKNTTQIQTEDKYIGIYTPDIYYKIEGNDIQKLKDYKISFVFVDENSQV
ncbi:MAG: hypothetical protein WC554_12575 [Clostridia bacterium]